MELNSQLDGDDKLKIISTWSELKCKTNVKLEVKLNEHPERTSVLPGRTEMVYWVLAD
jgi:hypothetical protein